MRNKVLIAALALALTSGCGMAAPWDQLTQRSISRTHQFIVYAEDENARAAIAMNAEQTKENLLKLLDSHDAWKHPIVIVLQRQSTAAPAATPSDVWIVNTEDGFKVEFNIVLGDDPREAHYPQQLMRAILLEYAYRDQPAAVRTGVSYAEPPAWLVDGLSSLAGEADPDAGSSLFRSLMTSGKAPTLATFLAEKPTTLDTPSRRLYSACAMSLVRMLLDQPGGPSLMQGFIRHWPGPDADPAAELARAFPTLNAGAQGLEKWWSLGLASLSASDRYQGISLEETGQQLDDLLKFEIVTDKAGTKKDFALDQYPVFKKYPGTKEALNVLSVRLLGLEGQGSPMMREVIAGYQTLVVKLAHGESGHLAPQLAALAEYRGKLSKRMDAIADYLNWYEATQRTRASGSFDEYVRTADMIDHSTDIPRSDPISRYLDSVNEQLNQ